MRAKSIRIKTILSGSENDHNAAESTRRHRQCPAEVVAPRPNRGCVEPQDILHETTQYRSAPQAEPDRKVEAAWDWRLITSVAAGQAI
jgi:hypothetical protein